jgi:hypothetical protein
MTGCEDRKKYYTDISNLKERYKIEESLARNKKIYIIESMIPFHIIYSWLFKSFRINGETELIQRLKNDNYKKIMIIKRSWIFALFTIWIPLVIISLGIISITIAYSSIAVPIIRNTIIIGNILMMIILTFSSIRYVLHFREIHKKAEISTDL